MLEKITIPEHGDVYEAVEDFTITYKTIHLTSFTDVGKARFPAGEHLIVDTCGSKHVYVYCDAANYKTIEDLLVPQSRRTSLTYEGYYFHITIKSLIKHCKKVSSL